MGILMGNIDHTGNVPSVLSDSRGDLASRFSKIFKTAPNDCHLPVSLLGHEIRDSGFLTHGRERMEFYFRSHVRLVFLRAFRRDMDDGGNAGKICFLRPRGEYGKIILDSGRLGVFGIPSAIFAGHPLHHAPLGVRGCRSLFCLAASRARRRRFLAQKERRTETRATFRISAHENPPEIGGIRASTLLYLSTSTCLASSAPGSWLMTSMT